MYCWRRSCGISEGVERDFQSISTSYNSSYLNKLKNELDGTSVLGIHEQGQLFYSTMVAYLLDMPVPCDRSHGKCQCHLLSTSSTTILESLLVTTSTSKNLSDHCIDTNHNKNVLLRHHPLQMLDGVCMLAHPTKLT